jgi:hypothetical protein
MQTKIHKTIEHPEVATTLDHIAGLWSKLGQYQKALNQFERVQGKIGNG